MRLRFLFALALAVGLASAQGTGGGGGRRGQRGGVEDMGPIRQQRATRFDVIADKLKLSKEQKEQAATIFDAAQEQATPLAEQIVNGRNQIVSAMVQGQGAGENFDKLMAAYSAVLTKMAEVEAGAYGKLYAILKPNQQAKAPQVFAENMAGLFAGRDWKRIR